MTNVMHYKAWSLDLVSTKLFGTGKNLLFEVWTMYIVLKTYETFILITLSIYYILMHRFNMYSLVRLIIIYTVL